MAIYDYLGNELKARTDGAPYMRVPWVSSMHRGYSSETVRENTLEAVHRAFLNGANFVEVDARLSSDNIYVVNHDETVVVNGVTHTISNETAATITALVLSTDQTYGDCHLPTLESILKFCAYSGMMVNIDCKSINATTLAKLVVDCGMSGKVVYANTSTQNATTILSTDPNAGFVFEYSVLQTWASALSDYRIRNKSYAWASTISASAVEATKALGFNYLLSEVSNTTNMHFNPDMVEFISTADCNSLNETYLNSLDFGLN